MPLKNSKIPFLMTQEACPHWYSGLGCYQLETIEMSISFSLSLVSSLFFLCVLSAAEGLTDNYCCSSVSGVSLFKSIIVMVKERTYFRVYTLYSEIL